MVLCVRPDPTGHFKSWARLFWNGYQWETNHSAAALVFLARPYI